MKEKLAYVLIIIICACNNGQTSSPMTKAEKEHFKDSFKKDILAREDSTFQSVLLQDTVLAKDGPIKILSFSIIRSDGGDYRNVRLSYQNVSQKKVSAIRFRWFGENAFGEPADMGGVSIFGNKGFGGGYTDDPIAAGAKDMGIWKILSKDAKKAIAAWPIEVVFADGTKWKIKESDN